MSLTPKQQLEQVNNPNLLSILSTIQGLPSQDSLKHGAYVWGKYQYTPAVTVENPQFDISCSNSTAVTIVNPNFDPSKVENYIDFFDGITATTTSTGHDYFQKLDGELTFVVASTRYKVQSYDGETGTFTLASKVSVNRTYVYTGTKNYSDEKKTFLDFVISDSPTAYPDGGEQDGYWYEKVVEGIPIPSGFTKYAIDKFTFTTSTKLNYLLSHSLKEKPKVALLLISPSEISNISTGRCTGGCIISNEFADGDISMFARKTNAYASGYVSIDANSVQFNSDNSSFYYQNGIEYTLITMA